MLMYLLWTGTRGKWKGRKWAGRKWTGQNRDNTQIYRESVTESRTRFTHYSRVTEDARTLETTDKIAAISTVLAWITGTFVDIYKTLLVCFIKKAIRI